MLLVLAASACASTGSKTGSASGGELANAGPVPDEARPYASDLQDLAKPCAVNKIVITAKPGKRGWFHVKGCTFDDDAYCNPAFRCGKKAGATACIPGYLMKKAYLKRPKLFCKEPG